jgi:hypothetical protein
MKKNKIILASVAALMAVSPMLSFGSQAHRLTQFKLQIPMLQIR